MSLSGRHKVFALSKERVEAERGPLPTFSEVPVRRLELRAGKYGTADFFDLNSVGSDSHLQFMNWSTALMTIRPIRAATLGARWRSTRTAPGRCAFPSH
jgi:hypothetical protein